MSSQESESEPQVPGPQEEQEQEEEEGEEEPRVSEPELQQEEKETVDEDGGDDGTNPSRSAGSSPSSAGGGAAGATVRPRSNRIMEPAPPTYEEALTFFVKDGNGSGTRGPLAITESPANGSSANGRSRPSLSDDYEMAERLQQEEIERCSVLQSGRERSTSLSAAAGPFSGGGRPSRNEGARWSVSSAPGDIRPVPRMSRALERSLISPRSGQLRTIHEDEEMVIGDLGTPRRRPPPDTCARACCYYSCFGFALFTDRLHPTLRQAWKEGSRQVIKTALPVFSTPWRYFFLSVKLMVVAACIILSFASTPLSGENIVRNASLVACLLVVTTERFISWCGCLGSKKQIYNKFSDISRNLLTDVSLYPAVVASIMNTLNTRSYNVVLSLWDESVYANVSNVGTVRRDDAINFSMNLLIVLLFVFMVHLLRLWQLGSIAKTLIGEFKKNVSGARSSARVFLILFFVHVLICSIVQILYLLLLGYRMHIEMNDPAQPQLFGISAYLFVMMVSGELLPLVGIFMYLITTQKWAEEFPIALFLDRIPSVQSLSLDISHERVEHKFKRLHESNMQCSGCIFGLIHPLVSPLQMILAVLFFGLWVLFAFTYPVTSVSRSSINMNLSDVSHNLAGVVGAAIVYGLVVILSLLTNLLPLLYGFLGLAMLPFWLVFYVIVGCSSLCRKKS